MIIDNLKIHALEEGDGQHMLLLHGWGCSVKLMQPIFDYYKQYYHVVMLDLPGFGESEQPHQVWLIDDYVLFIRHVLEYYNMCDQPIMIAHSFGARIALRYALKYEVFKLVLTGAAGIKDHHNLMYYLRVYTYKLLKRINANYANKMGSQDYKDSNAIMRGILVRAVNEDITPLLHQIKVETLLIFGSKDNQTPLWMGKRMAKEMPNATLIVFQGDDHFAYFHQMRRFLSVIEYFLRGGNV